MSALISSKNYHVINAKSKTLLTVSQSDHKSVVGDSLQTKDGHQRWELQKTSGGGWLLYCVKEHVFLSFDGDAKDGQKLQGLKKPYEWLIDTRGSNVSSNRIRVSKTDSKEVVDLSDHGNVQSGTAVQLWSDAGTDNQTWTFEEIFRSSSRYKITNVKSGTSLDVVPGDGMSVVGNGYRGINYQRWYVKVDDNDKTQFTIRNFVKGVQNFCGIDDQRLTNSGEPIIASHNLNSPYNGYDTLPVSNWFFERDEKNRSAYRLRHYNVQQFLDLSLNGSSAPGTRLQLANKAGDNQLWTFEEALQSDKKYRITNVNVGKVLDVSADDKKSVITFDFHGEDNQQWVLHQNSNDKWTIQSVKHSSYLGVEGDRKDGEPIKGVSAASEWELWHVGEPFVYTMHLAGTNLYATPSDSKDSKIGGPPLKLSRYVKAEQQRWRFEEM